MSCAFQVGGSRGRVVACWNQSRGSSDRYCSGASFITKFNLLAQAVNCPIQPLQCKKKWPQTLSFYSIVAQYFCCIDFRFGMYARI